MKIDWTAKEENTLFENQSDSLTHSDDADTCAAALDSTSTLWVLSSRLLVINKVIVG